MVVAAFKNSIDRLEASLRNAQKEELSIKEETRQNILFDYNKQKKESCKRLIKSNLDIINQKVWEMMSINKEESNKPKLVDLLNIIELLNEAKEKDDIQSMALLVNKIKQITSAMDIITPQAPIQIKIPELPEEIKEEMQADLDELKSCYQAGCYRSVVIICGRILETSLHRKYFEITGFDILEKNPGIGLGKLVAKLVEKQIELDPGLAQQIHLVNQVRIFSVHKKKSIFLPTKAQAQAIILYTLDIVEKLFRKTS